MPSPPIAAVPVPTPKPGNFASPKAELIPEKSMTSVPPPIVASTSKIVEQATAPPSGLAPFTLAFPAESQVTRALSFSSVPCTCRTRSTTTLETLASAGAVNPSTAAHAVAAKAQVWRALLIGTVNTPPAGK